MFDDVWNRMESTKLEARAFIPGARRWSTAPCCRRCSAWAQWTCAPRPSGRLESSSCGTRGPRLAAPATQATIIMWSWWWWWARPAPAKLHWICTNSKGHNEFSFQSIFCYNQISGRFMAIIVVQKWFLQNIKATMESDSTTEHDTGDTKIQDFFLKWNENESLTFL